MMKQIFFLGLFCVWSTHIYSQFTLKILVTEVAAKKGETVYLAGSFNNWNPSDPAYKLKPFGTNRIGIVLKDLPQGNYEFKFTRGKDKWETSAKGEDLPNRVIELNSDITLQFKVEGWKDDFPDKPKPNTAGKSVSIVDSAFFIPQLNRYRRIWMYLPPSYHLTKKKYPVIYMHDGQNLFNEQTAAFGEWGVDEALDTLMKVSNKEAIIIGIDNGGELRMREYLPYTHAKFGEADGPKYIDFIVHSLKPFIDAKYRTLKDSTNNFIAGSSLGGLISTYALATYPDVFGGAGIFSPSFWVSEPIYSAVKNARWGNQKKIFFYAGSKESNEMVPDMNRMIEEIKAKGNYKLRIIIDPLGVHNESSWRKQIADFYNFILN